MTSAAYDLSDIACSSMPEDKEPSLAQIVFGTPDDVEASGEMETDGFLAAPKPRCAPRALTPAPLAPVTPAAGACTTPAPTTDRSQPADRTGASGLPRWIVTAVLGLAGAAAVLGWLTLR